MSHTITVDEASTRMKELPADLAPGDEIVLTQDDRTVARVVPEPPTQPPLKDRVPGTLKGMLIENSDVPDDAHLKDFAEYME